LDDALRNAVIYCTEHGIMKDFLREHRTEALNMLTVEFKMEDALAVRFEEGMGKGREEGREDVARAMLADGLPAETIRKYTGLDKVAIYSLM
jgi:predicted transposase YdaD